MRTVSSDLRATDSDSARVRFSTAEFEAARGLVQIHAALTFRRAWRHVAKEAVTRPADRLAAFGTGPLTVEFGRAVPQTRQIAFVVRARVGVGDANAARRGCVRGDGVLRAGKHAEQFQ